MNEQARKTLLASDGTEELATISLEIFEYIVEKLRAGTDDDEDAARTTLEAIGTLVAIERSDLVIARVDDALKSTIAALMAKIELLDLDDAHVYILRDAPQYLPMDLVDCIVDGLHPVTQALRTRDRVELAWIGAELLGLVGSFSDEAVARRLRFDECVEPELYQLFTLEERAAELGWMKPSFQPRFWPKSW